MKKIKITLLLFTLLTTGLSFTACTGNNSNKTEQSKQGKEYTSAYICPMHCEGSGSESEGQCPVCGMDYVKNDKHDHDGHNH